MKFIAGFEQVETKEEEKEEVKEMDLKEELNVYKVLDETGGCNEELMFNVPDIKDMPTTARCHSSFTEFAKNIKKLKVSLPELKKTLDISFSQKDVSTSIFKFIFH